MFSNYECAFCMISLEKSKDTSDENSVHFRMYEIYPYPSSKKKEKLGAFKLN